LLKLRQMKIQKTGKQVNAKVQCSVIRLARALILGLAIVFFKFSEAVYEVM